MTSLQTDLNDHSLQKDFSEEGVKVSENEGERE
jgi:hypothetical protein